MKNLLVAWAMVIGLSAYAAEAVKPVDQGNTAKPEAKKEPIKLAKKEHKPSKSQKPAKTTTEKK